jgi:hypothetical protein
MICGEKKSIQAAERDTERIKTLRGAFLEAIQGEDFTRFKFVDEAGVNLTYTRAMAEQWAAGAYTRESPCTAAPT